MRLLYAFPEPLPLPRARGVQVAHAVGSLSAAGIEVDLAYVPVTEQSPLSPLGDDRCGVRLLPLSRGWPFPFCRLPPFSGWHSVRFFAARLRAAMAARRPDVLYVRHLKLAALLLRNTGHAPLVYEAHEVFADTARPDRRARVAAMESKVMREAAAVVCNSRATAERLAALYDKPAKLLVLPNAVTPLPHLPAKPWEACQRHVIYTGSFFGWKGVADLMAAAGSLDGFHITLVGGDPGQLARIRNELPASGADIDLLPRLSQSVVMERLAASCIAVLPNRPDPDSAFTSPIKLFEYMAAGCAIVAADLPPIREILAPDEAEWFAAGDPAALTAALRRLVANPQRAKAMGERLREKSAAYTWDRRAERLKAFLAETLASA